MAIKTCNSSKQINHQNPEDYSVVAGKSSTTRLAILSTSYGPMPLASSVRVVWHISSSRVL